MEEWKTTRLDEACQFINGLWKGEEPPFVRVGVIRNTNFAKDGYLDDTEIAYLDVEAKKFAKRRLQFGDIILEKSGGGPKQPVGRVVLFDKTQGDFSFSNFTAAIRLKEPKELDPAYLHRYLHWFYLCGRTEAMQSHSTGIRNLNSEAYKAIRVDYPPLPAQRRIVAILDEAFEAIAIAKANTEKNLQNARGLLGRYLATAFAVPDSRWETRALGEAVRFIDYRGKTPPKREDGIRLITAKNVKMGFVQRDPEEFIDSSVYEGWMTRGFPRKGDVLFTTEAPLGNVAQLDTDERVVIGQRLITMQPIDASLDRAFLKYALMSPLIQDSIQAKGTGATVLGIKASLLKTVLIWYPRDIEEQRRMVGRINAIEEEAAALASLSAQKLLALDDLKKSLLHQAFTGQLIAKSTDKQVAEVA